MTESFLSPLRSRPLFSAEEVRYLQVGEPELVEQKVTVRGLDSGDFLQWSRSNNIYLNPTTQQKFNVEIKTSNPAAHVEWQQHLQIAARVETSIQPKTSPGLINQAKEAPVTGVNDTTYTHYDSVSVCLTLVDAGDVKPPYRVVFLVDPTELQDDTATVMPASALPRTGLDLQTEVHVAGQPRFTNPLWCRGMDVTVTAIKNSVVGNLSWSEDGNPAKLSWSEDGAPTKGSYYPIKQGAEHQFIGHTNNNQYDNFILSVDSELTAMFTFSGSYEP